MHRNNATAKTKVTVKRKVSFQVTEEEVLEITEEISSQLPPPPHQHRKVSGDNPRRRALPKGKPPQQRQQRPQRKQLSPPKKEPVRKLVGSISADTLRQLAQQQNQPQLQAVPDIYFDLLKRKKSKQKALAAPKSIKALPAPKRKRRSKDATQEEAR